MQSEPVRNAKWQRRLDEIADVAAGLFAHRGYAATGVSDLCAAVGLGRGALYYYIESKENLLSLIHNRIMAQLLASAHDVERLNASPEDQLRLLGIELVRIIATFPDHVWVVLHEYRALTGSRATVFREKRREFEDVVSGIIEAGVSEGVFRATGRDLTMLAWLGMHNYTYIWLRSGGQYSPLEIATTYHSIFTMGILSR